MNILITGTSGFIGSRVLKTARSKDGTNVKYFSSSAPDKNGIMYSNHHDFDLELKDLNQINEIDVLVHAGSFTPKSVAEANDSEKCNSNIIFTEQLLSLPFHNLKKILYLSSIDVYGILPDAISEDSPTNPSTLYGMSKLYCERMIENYANIQSIQYNLLRVGHAYGPGEEKYSKVIPNAIRNIIAGKDVELWGEGSELRSFIYIDDVVAAIINAIQQNVKDTIINIVGGKAISILALLDLLISMGSRRSRIVKKEFRGVSHDVRFNNDRLHGSLLSKEIDLHEGLQKEFQYFETIQK